MENGNDENVIEQFDKIAFLPDQWDHNQQYQNYLLKNIPPNCRCILDVGCGTGELTKKLVPYSSEIIGIDVSENMINEAGKRNNDRKINYIKVSAEKYLEDIDRKFDVIISIAALHHMNEEKILETMRNRLTKEGKIIILDLVKGSIVDYVGAMTAVPLSIILRLKNNGKARITKEQREAWEGHFHYDNYLTIKEVKSIVRKKLGKAKVKKHLFWRYSIVYKNG
ncbi:MAG: class I SAM-dependent methyltransferase [Treponema sp.]|nr:class I SAM-dependent methyltransferase [Treponema sp.]